MRLLLLLLLRIWRRAGRDAGSGGRGGRRGDGGLEALVSAGSGPRVRRGRARRDWEVRVKMG